MFSAIYACPNPNRRQELWTLLSSFRSRCQVPWLALGDFNEICSPSEVWGGGFCEARALEMMAMMDSCSFMDMGFTGSKYTWERHVDGQRVLVKRLDRALGDVAWRVLYAEAYVEHLARVYSDHAPLLVRCEASLGERRSRPFRFQAAWATHPSFENLVGHAWEPHGLSLKDKLVNTQQAAQKFNKEVFGCIHRRKWRVEGRCKESRES